MLGKTITSKGISMTSGRWDTRTLRCICHNQDVCPDHEAECYRQQEELYWNSLSEVEKQAILDYEEASSHNYLCHHAPTTECAGWLQDEEGEICF
jgi:hypothetical protein